MPWRRLLNRVCRPQDMCLVYGLLWQNYVWKSLFLEKIRTLSACKDSWMEARLWPNVRSRLSWKTRKWSFLQCHPIHLPVNWFWHLFDSFLTTFSWLLFQLANQNATREGVGWSKSGTWHLRLSKFLHFSVVTSNRRQQEVVKKSSELNNFFEWQSVGEHHSKGSH